MIPALILAATAAPTAVGLGVLVTGLFLGIRHGIDWDHIAAITDITSTTASANLAEAAHEGQHLATWGHSHHHGGQPEMRAHDAGLGVPMLAAFVVGLLLSNLAIVVISSVGFVSSQARERVYVAFGGIAGVFSLVVGAVFLLGLNGGLPDLGNALPF
jgi:hypothetical protein